jgi:hypothetical protein
VKDGKKRNKIDSLRREISRTFSTINQRHQEIWGWIGFFKKEVPYKNVPRPQSLNCCKFASATTQDNTAEKQKEN